VIYFAPCDYDAPEADQGKINAYLDGAAGIIGRARLGFYGGYWPLKRAFDAGKMTYGWQTYAWSGGNVDPRAQLYQYRNGQRLGPAEVDFDDARAADFGQWPRPSAPQAGDDDMGAPAWLPSGRVVPLAFDPGEVARIRFVSTTTEKIKLDWLPSPQGHADSVYLDLSYAAGAQGEPVPDGCEGARVVRGPLTAPAAVLEAVKVAVAALEEQAAAGNPLDFTALRAALDTANYPLISTYYVPT
jgi:hypothetical protein